MQLFFQQWLVSRLHPDLCNKGTKQGWRAFTKASQSCESDAHSPLYRFVCFIRLFRGVCLGVGANLSLATSLKVADHSAHTRRFVNNTSQRSALRVSILSLVLVCAHFSHTDTRLRQLTKISLHLKLTLRDRCRVLTLWAYSRLVLPVAAHHYYIIGKFVCSCSQSVFIRSLANSKFVADKYRSLEIWLP